MPLILRSEFDEALAGVLAPDAVMGAARAAGLESAMLEPRCMARRRVSEPGSTRSVYFVVFDAPAFGLFREAVSESLRVAGGQASAFDPAALSPVLIVAGTDENFARWLPLTAMRDAGPHPDCIAPIDVQ
jgi:hypothetical protein